MYIKKIINMDVSCHCRCGILKNPHYSMAMIAEKTQNLQGGMGHLAISTWLKDSKI